MKWTVFLGAIFEGHAAGVYACGTSLRLASPQPRTSRARSPVQLAARAANPYDGMRGMDSMCGMHSINGIACDMYSMYIMHGMFAMYAIGGRYGMDSMYGVDGMDG